MSNKNKNTVTTNVSLPIELAEELNCIADEMGVSFNEACNIIALVGLEKYAENMRDGKVGPNALETDSH